MGTLSLTDAVNNTTADASLVNTNNAAIKAVVNGGIDNTNINASAGIVGSKLGLTYAAYTPTWASSGTQPVIGNAVVVARYMQAGKIVHCWGKIVFGSTSTFGTGTYTFALPVAAVASAVSNAALLGSIVLFDSSASNALPAGPFLVTATTLNVQYPATYGGTITTAGAAAPWTWDVSDIFTWNFTYEAA